MNKQKNKILTLRTNDDTRSKAHKAANLLYGQTLSEFLTGKIERLITEYDRESPRILRANKKSGKQVAVKGSKIKKDKVVSLKPPKSVAKLEKVYFIDSGITVD